MILFVLYLIHVCFPFQTTVIKPFFVSLDLPYSVIRGEEFLLQATVFNYMEEDQDVIMHCSYRPEVENKDFT